MHIIDELESEVRRYSRTWPTVFEKGRGSILWDITGNAYIDFFAGAGALNYGHSNPHLKSALTAYIADDGIVHGLDMATAAKMSFLEMLRDAVLAPRALDYKVQFTGPSGANAVEAALKIVRKVTRRPTVVAFTNAFHGMSAGALAVSGSEHSRAGAGMPLGHVIRVPYEGFHEGIDGLVLLEAMLADGGCGTDMPGAVIVETVQGEGGVIAASPEWLRRLAGVCGRHGMLLVVDDVQMGCGRTGTFFSHEAAGIYPDVVCLSKAISGYGLPMSLVLMRPHLDVWTPGEHSGTFRGNNLAFVTATEALRRYWTTEDFTAQIAHSAGALAAALAEIQSLADDGAIVHRGRGMAQGLAFADAPVAAAVCRYAYENGLLVETSGPRNEVVKLLPPLTTDADVLESGLAILAKAVKNCL